jgi:hypothetical protein
MKFGAGRGSTSNLSDQLRYFSYRSTVIIGSHKTKLKISIYTKKVLLLKEREHDEKYIFNLLKPSSNFTHHQV